jgi:hypothetical protein
VPTLEERIAVLETQMQQMHLETQRRSDAARRAAESTGTWLRWGFGIVITIMLAIFVQHQATEQATLGEVRHTVNTSVTKAVNNCLNNVGQCAPTPAVPAVPK